MSIHYGQIHLVAAFPLPFFTVNPYSRYETTAVWVAIPLPDISTKRSGDGLKARGYLSAVKEDRSLCGSASEGKCQATGRPAFSRDAPVCVFDELRFPFTDSKAKGSVVETCWLQPESFVVHRLFNRTPQSALNGGSIRLASRRRCVWWSVVARAVIEVRWKGVVEGEG
jgi:hypothetical protein